MQINEVNPLIFSEFKIKNTYFSPLLIVTSHFKSFISLQRDTRNKVDRYLYVCVVRASDPFENNEQ